MLIHFNNLPFFSFIFTHRMAGSNPFFSNLSMHQVMSFPPFNSMEVKEPPQFPVPQSPPKPKPMVCIGNVLHHPHWTIPYPSKVCAVMLARKSVTDVVFTHTKRNFDFDRVDKHANAKAPLAQ